MPDVKSQETRQRMREAASKRWIGHSVNIACPVCRTQVIKPKSTAAKYCSVECRNYGYQIGQRRICPICREEFYNRPSRAQYETCSPRCRGQLKLRQMAAAPDYQRFIQLACKNCGKIYSQFPSRRRRSKYCSRSCANQFLTGQQLSADTKHKMSLGQAEAIRTGHRLPAHAKRCPYEDRQGRQFVFRSGWELAIAKKLDAANLSWDYETTIILLPDGRAYVPDFWVSELNRHLEVKGRLLRGIDKVESARVQGHAIELITDPKGWNPVTNQWPN